MPKKTARLYSEDLPGWGGYARIYQLDPPLYVGGLGYRYVTIVVHPEQEHKSAEVALFYTDEFGRPAESSLRKRGGSYNPNSDPHEDGQHHLNGCFVWALASCDKPGYEIEGYGAQKLPPGLDYDPEEPPE